METKQPMRIFCKANPSLSMSLRDDGEVILVRNDPKDKSQHWILDYDSVGKLTDEQDRRAFALVHRTKKQALIQTVENGWYQLKLAPYSSDEGVKVSMLWSLGVKLDSGFSEIRALKNLRTSLNASGGAPVVGTKVVIFNSEPYYDHAIWKIVPVNHGNSLPNLVAN